MSGTCSPAGDPGTRVTVHAIEGRLRDGKTADEILADYPELRREDVEAAALYARAKLLVRLPSRSGRL